MYTQPSPTQMMQIRLELHAANEARRVMANHQCQMTRASAFARCWTGSAHHVGLPALKPNVLSIPPISAKTTDLHAMLKRSPRLLNFHIFRDTRSIKRRRTTVSADEVRLFVLVPPGHPRLLFL